MSLCCTVGYKWVTVMDGVKFEFKDIIIIEYEKRFCAETVCQPRIYYNITVKPLLFDAIVSAIQRVQIVESL